MSVVQKTEDGLAISEGLIGALLVLGTLTISVGAAAAWGPGGILIGIGAGCLFAFFGLILEKCCAAVIKHL